MALRRRVTPKLPKGLLDDGMEATGKGVTETLVAGLDLLRRNRAYRTANALRGKVKLNIDLDESRERLRR